MRIGTLQDGFYAALVWTPVLTFLGFCLLAVGSGVAHLEASTFGTEYVIPQDAGVRQTQLGDGFRIGF